MVLPHHVLCLPLVCGEPEPRNKFNQRSEKMQKQGKTVKGDHIPHNNSLVIKHSQKHLVPP